MAEPNQSGQNSRRDFLGNIIMGGGLLASVAVGLRNVFAFIFPRAEPPHMRKLLVGRTGEITPGTAEELEIGGRLLYLIYLDGEYRVFSGECTHLGCQVRWEGFRNRFFCPCHQGVFAATGEVLSGPPPTALNEYRVEVEDSLIFMWIEAQPEGRIA